MLVIDDPVYAAELANALDKHIRDLSKFAPPSLWRPLAEVRDALRAEAKRGHSRTSGGRGVVVVEDVPVEPVVVVETPEFVSYGTAGRMLGVTSKTVSRWVAAGRLRSCRPGGRSMIAASEIERFKREVLDGGADAPPASYPWVTPPAAPQPKVANALATSSPTPAPSPQVSQITTPAAQVSESTTPAPQSILGARSTSAFIESRQRLIG